MATSTASSQAGRTVRSSRRLETESGRNLELMWLLKRLTPDFKTLADFRRDNRRAIRRVCWQFILFCRKLDLFGGELVAIDGSKFKAQNAKGRNFTQSKLKRQMKELEKKVDEYLEELDEADEGQKDLPDKPNADQLREKIEAMKRRQAELRQLEEHMKESGESQISLTDPDSRSMPVGGGEATVVGYNVQLSVDSKYKLIVDHEVTSDVTDLGLLSRLAGRAKQALGVAEMDVIADKGYYDGQEVKACLEENITPYIPKANTSANRKRGLFTKEDFRYDPDQDGYVCPAGQTLTYRFTTVEQEREIRYPGLRPGQATATRLPAASVASSRNARATRVGGALPAGSTSTCSKPCRLGFGPNPIRSGCVSNSPNIPSGPSSTRGTRATSSCEA